MYNGYIPKLGFQNQQFNLHRLDGSTLSGGIQKSFQLDDGVQKPSFKQIMSDTVSNVNSVIQTPNGLMQDAMTTGRVDVHDVMIANAKAELAVTITAQVATKVVQAYDRILQIQV
jgi:flagellar hook-basal body complex protein FliE